MEGESKRAIDKEISILPKRSEGEMGMEGVPRPSSFLLHLVLETPTIIPALIINCGSIPNGEATDAGIEEA